MPVDETKFTHVRLTKDNGDKMKRITTKTHRSVNIETNLAVKQYKPRTIKFKDDGR